LIWFGRQIATRRNADRMNAINVIAVPYELSRLRDGIGRGPEELLASGVAEALGAAGASVQTEVLQLAGDFSSEVAACFELIRRVRERVDAALAAGGFPVILSGSCCFAALGAVTALDQSPPGVVWFDAHGDFNTPETTTSGYFDGMALAVLTGSAWQGMLRTVTGAGPLPESAIVLAGARDFDQDEERRLRGSEIQHLQPGQIVSGDALAGAIDAIDPEPAGLYLHVDLDVLDREEAPVNVYSAPGGITAEQLASRVEEVLRRGSVRALALTAYDPQCDGKGRVPPVANRLLRSVASHG
jgi:arginase